MTQAKPRKVDSDNVDAPAAEAETKDQRFVTVGGIPYPVVDTYYDPMQDCVVDILEVKKVVKNRRGDDVDVITYRKIFCKVEEIQEKYRRGSQTRVEVK